MTGYTIDRFRGKAKDIGIAIGKSVGRNRFLRNINEMIEAIDRNYGIDFDRLEKESMLWLKSIPDDYQEELNGVSLGAECSIEKIAKWYYSSMCIKGGCTSFIVKVDNSWWVGRNNDYILPKVWDYINIIEVNDKIPVMLFGLEGDIFSGTGFNKEKLWIHYNWLPVWDNPANNRKVIPPFIFVRRALEKCRSINDIEMLLKDTVRDDGMNLFVIDGKSNEAAVFECTCKKYKRRMLEKSFIAGANHYCTIEVADDCEFDFGSSVNRQLQLEKLLSERNNEINRKNMIDILADPGVEQYNNLSGMVYSNVACPGKDLIWFACDGFPAASESNWEKVEWNW